MVLAFSFFLQAHAVTLPQITPSAQKALPINVNAPNIECGKIADALAEYAKMTNNHDLAVYGFLNEVTNKVSEWYSILSPLENTQQTLPVGVFLPLQDGADKITEVGNIASENTTLLATEMERIKISLSQCVLTPK